MQLIKKKNSFSADNFFASSMYYSHYQSEFRLKKENTINTFTDELNTNQQ